MKTRLGLIAAALISMVPVLANAAPVMQTQTQVLNSNGQDMGFLFSALPASNGAGGMVTIASGNATLFGGIAGLDLSGAFPGESEHFEVTLDGGSKGFFSCGGPSNNGATAIGGATDNSFNFNDCVFTLQFSLLGAELNALLADGDLTVGVLFGADVSTFGHGDEVVVSLSYDSAVPEPGSLALLGLGFAGIAAWRRRK